MPETLTRQSQETFHQAQYEKDAQLQHVGQHSGDIALDGFIESGDLIAPAEAEPFSRNIELGGVTYETNLPESVDAFNLDSWKHLQVRPEELDKLPAGSFRISNASNKREITVFETEHGKAIDAEAIGKFGLQRGVETLMTDLGYLIEGEPGDRKVKAVPTPDTLKSAAAKLDVDIEFMDTEDKYIKGRDYLEAYRDKKYPASLKDYQHDIEDGHLTAVVLGGEPLKIALSDVADRALAKWQEAIDHAAVWLDNFTNELRYAVHGDDPEDETRLDRAGNQLGLAPETTQEILRTAQENARAYGLEVKELL